NPGAVLPRATSPGIDIALRRSLTKVSLRAPQAPGALYSRASRLAFGTQFVAAEDVHMKVVDRLPAFVARVEGQAEAALFDAAHLCHAVCRCHHAAQECGVCRLIQGAHRLDVLPGNDQHV